MTTQKKSEIRMTKPERNPKSKDRSRTATAARVRISPFGFLSAFGFRYPDLIRHPSFVIRH